MVGVPVVGAVWWWREKISAWVAMWIPLLVGILSYMVLQGPHEVEWQTSWGRNSGCRWEGDVLYIENVRDFCYRTEEDYDVVYRQERYDLRTLCGVDFAACHWDGMTAVCHTMLSFHFEDGRRLVVSAETRLPQGISQNSVAGLYKKYGILYIFGTEEDIFRLRTNYRHEDLSVYPLNINPENGKKLLLHYVKLSQQSEMEHTPYNTLSSNCSTGLVSAFRELAPDMPWYYDLLPIHNGSFVHLLYAAGAFQTRAGETEEQLRQRCYLGYDLAPENRQDYSAAIRRHLNRDLVKP